MGEQYEHIYTLLPVHKAQEEFFDHQLILPLYLQYTSPTLACRPRMPWPGDLFKMNPHFKQLTYAVWTPLWAKV